MELVYVWIGTALTARVVANNPQPLPMASEVHVTIAGFDEQVQTVEVPANGSLTVDFPGYQFTVAGIYPAGGYICEPGNPSNVYTAIVAKQSLEVLESQLAATVEWV